MSAVSKLHQIVYVSTAHRAFSHDELQSLLVECRANNQEHGITGMLLYHDGGFIQALEGQEADVLHVYDRIVSDSRHRCIIKPLERSVKRRNFPHWKMGFQNLDAKTINLPGFTRFLQEPSPRREIRDELDLSLQLLFSFKESDSQPVA